MYRVAHNVTLRIERLLLLISVDAFGGALGLIIIFSFLLAFNQNAVTLGQSNTVRKINKEKRNTSQKRQEIHVTNALNIACFLLDLRNKIKEKRWSRDWYGEFIFMKSCRCSFPEVFLTLQSSNFRSALRILRNECNLLRNKSM